VNQSFKKAERLSRYGLIRKLFAEGSTFQIPAFRVTWLRIETDAHAQAMVMFSIPKHRLHEAVKRNLVRRRMRESYRLHKKLLFEPFQEKPHTLLICITYTAKEILPYADIQAKIILLLQRLTKENEKLDR